MQDETKSLLCYIKYVCNESLCFHTVKMNISQSTEVLVATKRTVITCSLSDLCLASDPKMTWKGLRSKQYFPLRYRLKEGNALKYYEQLVYTPVPEDHQAEITCEVTFGKNLTASATVALTVHCEYNLNLFITLNILCLHIS